MQHLDDIIRNATLYRARWGSWPMTGWLDAFASAGLVEWTRHGVRRRPSSVS